jgi:hypothetical protein
LIFRSGLEFSAASENANDWGSQVGKVIDPELEVGYFFPPEITLRRMRKVIAHRSAGDINPKQMGAAFHLIGVRDLQWRRKEVRGQLGTVESEAGAVLQKPKNVEVLVSPITLPPLHVAPERIRTQRYAFD